MENEIVTFNVNPLKDGNKAVVHNNFDNLVLEYENEAYQFDTTSEFYSYFYYRFFVGERTKSDRLRQAHENTIEHCGLHEYHMDNYMHILTVKISPQLEGVNVAFGKDTVKNKYVLTYKDTHYFFTKREEMMRYFDERFIFMAKKVSPKNLTKRKAELESHKISA